MIRIVKSKNIDPAKYQKCLNESGLVNFNAQIPVLNFLCKDWKLLVYGDYEYCAILPFKQKLGLNFILNPLFCQQLGVFGSGLNEKINDEFLNFINENFRVKFYSFNSENRFSVKLPERKNYIIPKQDYSDLRRKYSKGRKSVLKGVSDLFINSVQLNAENFIFINENLVGLEKEKDRQFFYKYLKFLDEENQLVLHGVFDGNTLINLSIVIKFKEQINLLGLINAESAKDKNGSSFLVDQLLQNYISENDFNFMGGNIRGIEIFFKSFGAEMKSYPYLENSTKVLVHNLFR